LVGSWPIATSGTIAEGARLIVEEVAAAVWCPACDAAQPIDEYFALVCPVCGTPTANLVSGREFEVTFADLDGP
jgi:hydrogenase nickel incorporation protein HypA/HybF